MPAKRKGEDDSKRLAKGVRTNQNRAGLDEHEKILYARSLAATPDERWQMNETTALVRFVGALALKKFRFNS